MAGWFHFAADCLALLILAIDVAGLVGSLFLRFAIDDGKHLFRADRYSLPPRIQTLRGILAKFGQIAPAPLSAVRPPTPEDRGPSRRPRGRSRRR